MALFPPPITQALGWAGVLIALAFANRFGLIADKDAAVMFAIVPALWIAATSPRCRRSVAR